MKRSVHALFAVALSMPAGAVLAQAAMKGMDMSAQPTAGTSAVHRASATVTKVDRQAGTVTLAHGPIPTLKWPAMTMAFKVRDPRLFDKLVAGKKVDIELAQDGKNYAVTAVR